MSFNKQFFDREVAFLYLQLPSLQTYCGTYFEHIVRDFLADRFQRSCRHAHGIKFLVQSFNLSMVTVP